MLRKKSALFLVLRILAAAQLMELPLLGVNSQGPPLLFEKPCDSLEQNNNPTNKDYETLSAEFKVLGERVTKLEASEKSNWRKATLSCLFSFISMLVVLGFRKKLHEIKPTLITDNEKGMKIN